MFNRSDSAHGSRPQAGSEVLISAMAPNQMALSSRAANQCQQHPSGHGCVPGQLSDTAVTSGTGTSQEDMLAGQQVAVKMHVLHVHAMDKAWQQQQQQQHRQPLPPFPCKTRQAAAATAPAAACVQACTDASAALHCTGLGKHARSASMQQPGVSSKSATASTAERLNWAASVPLASEPLSELVNPQQYQQQQSQHASTSCKAADMSADTENLVAKLRALSSDKHTGSAKGKAVKAPQQGFLYKPRAAKRSRTAITDGGSIDSSIAPSGINTCAYKAPLAAASGPASGLLSRCSSQASAGHHPQHPAHPAHQPWPDLQPSRHATAQHRPTAVPDSDMSLAHAQPTGQCASGWQSLNGRQHAVQSSHKSAKIPDVAAVPLHSDTEGRPGLHEAPVNHRMGKVTPLKSSFTPRPSRFRLEAERCSPHPHDGCSDGLQQVLFASPVKQDSLAMQCQDVSMEPAMIQTTTDLSDSNTIGCEQLRQLQQQQATQSTAHNTVDYAQASTVAPRSVRESGAACSLATPVAAARPVFNSMHFIVDPDFLPDQQHRYAIRC